LLDVHSLSQLFGAWNTLLPPLPWYWLEAANKDLQLGPDLSVSWTVAFLLNTDKFIVTAGKIFIGFYLE